MLDVNMAPNRVWAFVAVNLVLGLAAIALFMLFDQDPTIVYYGSAVIGMLAVVISFSAPFPSGLGNANGGPSLTEMVHKLRSKGYRTGETPKSITVQFDRWSAIDLRYQKRGNGSRLIYRLDAPPSKMALILFMFLTIYFCALAIPLCIFLLLQGERNAKRFAIPTIGRETNSGQSSMNEIKNLLIESLSECRKLAEVAYRGAHSVYEDYILTAVAVIGVIGWMVLLVIFNQMPLFDSTDRLLASALLALIISAVGCSTAIFLIIRMVKPKVTSLHHWTVRLDQAINSELYGQMPERGESSIEVLFSAYDEMPMWLGERRKSMLYRHPVPYVLTILLTLFGTISIFSSLILITLGIDLASSLLTLAVGAGSLGIGLWLWRWIMKEEMAEENRLAQESADRREHLRTMLDLHLEESGDE